MKGLLRVLPVVALVAIALPGIEKKGSFDITERKGSFDITERKGSFDITEFIVSGAAYSFVLPGEVETNGKDPEFPVTPN
jgi:hypothetical protein